MKALIAVVCSFALTGCATHPVAPNHARQAPTDRVMAFQAASGPSDGTVLVIRDSGALGSGCRAAVYIDGKESALLSTSEKASFTVPAGDHILGTGPSGNGICGMGGAKTSLVRRITINVKPQHTSIYRLAVLGDGGITVMPISL